MAKKPKNQTAEEIALKLADVRTRMAADKALDKVLTTAFKEALGREQKDRAGNYKVTTSSVFKVISEDLALPFALQRGLVNIDVAKAHAVFRLDPTLRMADPQTYGFELAPQTKVVPISSRNKEEE